MAGQPTFERAPRMRSPRFRTIRSLLICGLGGFVVACGAEPPNVDLYRVAQDVATPMERRDSAGVEVVVNRNPAWAEGDGWTVDTEPSLEIGLLFGDVDYQFGGINDVRRNGAGQVLVAESQTEEIRLYDSGGTFLARLGRFGEGPGEFTNLARIGAYRGDTVFAVDSRKGTVSFFLPDGTFARDISYVGRLGRGTTAVGVTGTGDLLLHRRAYRPNSDDPEGVLWDSVAVLRLRLADQSADTVGVFPWEQGFQDGRRWDDDLTFAASSRFEVTDQGFVWARSDRFEFHRFAPDGTLRQIIRVDRGATDVSGRVVGEYEDTRLIAYAESRDTLDPQFDARRDDYLDRLREDPVAPVLPTYSTFMVDRCGAIWARRYTHLAGGPSRTWEVFDVTGRWLGGVQLPERFTPESFGCDEIVGVWRDEWDVPHVRGFKILGRTPTETDLP